MRIAYVSVLFAAFLVAAPAARAQSLEPPVAPVASGQLTVEAIIERMNKAEQTVLARLRTYHPLMEVYLQNLALDEARGWLPNDDNYFLGQFYLEDEVPSLRAFGQTKKLRGLVSRVVGGGGVPFIADGFAAMAAPDWRVLDSGRYEFKYVRREFLGEARCFVFDVKPITDGKGKGKA